MIKWNARAEFDLNFQDDATMNWPVCLIDVYQKPIGTPLVRRRLNDEVGGKEPGAKARALPRGQSEVCDRAVLRRIRCPLPAVSASTGLHWTIDVFFLKTAVRSYFKYIN